MRKRILPVILLCSLFFFIALLPANAATDYGDRVLKALSIPKKTGMEGIQQDREVGLLLLTTSSMQNISTALMIFSTDHSGKYPASLNELVTGKYLSQIPPGRSKTGRVPIVYSRRNDGKGFSLMCKGTHFSQFGIPADYPRMADNSDSRKTATIWLKPNVPKPPYEEPTAKSRARDMFKEAVYQLPDLLKKRDPKQAKEVRLQAEKAIRTGELGPDEVQTLQKLIKTCKEIESGKKK